jgi:hypothetical protein
VGFWTGRRVTVTGGAGSLGRHAYPKFTRSPSGRTLDHQHPQDDGRRGAESALSRAKRMPVRQRGHDDVHTRVILEDGVDPPERRIPELLAIREEQFEEAALPLRPPHHGASGDLRACGPGGERLQGLLTGRLHRRGFTPEVAHRVHPLVASCPAPYTPERSD